MEFRAGSSGVGAFGGCGVGIGILSPVNLRSIPIMGQIESSISSSCRSLDTSILGGRVGIVANHVQNVLSSSQVDGVRAGFGCGVLLGYGYGIGFFAKPHIMSNTSQFLNSISSRIKEMVPIKPPVPAETKDKKASPLDVTIARLEQKIDELSISVNNVQTAMCRLDSALPGCKKEE